MSKEHLLSRHFCCLWIPEVQQENKIRNRISVWNFRCRSCLSFDKTPHSRGSISTHVLVKILKVRHNCCDNQFKTNEFEILRDKILTNMPEKIVVKFDWLTVYQIRRCYCATSLHCQFMTSIINNWWRHWLNWSPVPDAILYVSVTNRNATGAQFNQIVGTWNHGFR